MFLPIPGQQPPSIEFAYEKALGWSEYDEEGDKRPVRILVMRCDIGYSVFRDGQDVFHLHWDIEKEGAIEWAVDRARQEIADHELKQTKREGNGKT